MARAFILPLLLTCFATSCAQQTNTVFRGSTPCDAYIRSVTGIPANMKCDFIKWELNLINNKDFTLIINYGEAQPNTSGFWHGGDTNAITGSYAVKTSNGRKLYTLSTKLSSTIELAEINNDILHFTNNQHQLLVGNGGWGYVLNKETSSIKPSAEKPNGIFIGKFDGRTPCQELAKQFGVQKSPDCFKIKWRLLLYRDSLQTNTGNYVLEGLFNETRRPITGRWHITKGTPADAEAIVYQLGRDSSAPIFLLKADDNILFFLDQQKNVLKGNRDFSYTLNRMN